MHDPSAVQDLLAHLARMHSAGLPWLESLALWRDHCRRPRQRQALERLMNHLRQGMGLTQALAQEGWIGGPLQALSQAAESSGRWASHIELWLTHQKQAQRLKRQLRSALTYPVAVLSLSLLVMIGVMQWVLPVFEGLYAQLPTTLPWPTRSLLQLRETWPIWGGLLSAGWLGAAGLALMARRHPTGRLRLELLQWRCPLWGQWRQMHLESRWCGLLSQLLQSGLDWSSALRLTGPASGSPLLALSTRQTLLALERGLGPAEALTQANRAWQRRCGRDIHSPALIQWLQAAEATGTLAQALDGWSRSQSDTLLAQWEVALRLLEPALMSILGLFMAWLVLALYLPVMDMGQWL
jgi:type II secretory pathway component PulF